MPKAVITCLCLLLLLSLCALSSRAQALDDNTDKILSIPDKLIGSIHKQAVKLNARIERQTEEYLQRLARKESKIQRRLSKLDSAAAKNLFTQSATKYAALTNNLKHGISSKGGSVSGEYLPYLDSLKGALSFLENGNGTALLKGNDLSSVTTALNEIRQLQGRLQDALQIKQLIRERKQQIKDALSKYTDLPIALKKSLDSYNKEAYYYAAQIREYKEILNNPDKLEQRALGLLNQLPAFRDFMKEHSELAGLFRLPGSYADPLQGLIGLQTRDQVTQGITSRLGGGPNAGQMFRQQVYAAQNQLNRFKDKLRSLGSGSGDMDMPDFKPNNQKTRPFLKRIELGVNMQTQHATRFYPSRTDIALSAGYRLSDGKIAGLGVSYAIGWGRDIKHVAFSSAGIGFRSFIDVKMKGSFYASGGLEYNYQRPFKSFQQIKNINNWQQSGLLGVSKIVDVRSRVFKKTKLALLWDFLSYRQVPRGQPLKFRVGYSVN
jgi:hypothetical protein